MDIDVILNPEKGLMEFTGSSTAGPSGQEPQTEPFVRKLFDKPLRREEPPTSPFEVHGMKNVQTDLEDDELPESALDGVQNGSLVRYGKAVAIVREIRFDYPGSKASVALEVNGKTIQKTIKITEG